MKRIFDIAATLVGLIVLTPVFALLYFLIREKGAPVVFKHYRIGKGGTPFPCFKFRTMFADADVRLTRLLHTNPEAKAEWDASYKLKNDPRVTPIGRFLRKTSLDELPQLFNVIRGEMSLVGPRPILQEELDRFYTTEEQKLYCSVTPGITGLWQVQGRSELDYPTRVKLDMQYIQHHSLATDIYILVKTVHVLFSRKGAY